MRFDYAQYLGRTYYSAKRLRTKFVVPCIDMPYRGFTVCRFWIPLAQPAT